MRKLLVLCGLSFALAACSDAPPTSSSTTAPPSQIEARQARNGSMINGNEDSGITLLGGHKKEEGGGGLGVNSYLWRATLDTVSFMPLVSADPFGGTIITDWYEDPKTPGERFKVNALILDKSLRADGIKITVFKQTMSHGMWRDQKTDSKLEQSLEDTVLTRARQLRIAQLDK